MGNVALASTSLGETSLGQLDYDTLMSEMRPGETEYDFIYRICEEAGLEQQIVAYISEMESANQVEVQNNFPKPQALEHNHTKEHRDSLPVVCRGLCDVFCEARKGPVEPAWLLLRPF